MDLGVTVLTSLGGGHFNDLTGSSLDDNVAVLSQGRTLHGVGKRGTGISGLEGVVVIVISGRHAVRIESESETHAITYQYINLLYQERI